MASSPISSKTFTVQAEEQQKTSGAYSRHVRRIILPSDVLKVSKIFAGDILAVKLENRNRKASFLKNQQDSN